MCACMCMRVWSSSAFRTSLWGGGFQVSTSSIPPGLCLKCVMSLAIGSYLQILEDNHGQWSNPYCLGRLSYSSCNLGGRAATEPGRARPSEPVCCRPLRTIQPRTREGLGCTLLWEFSHISGFEDFEGGRLKDRSYNNCMFRFCVVTLKKFVISISTKPPSDILDTGESWRRAADGDLAFVLLRGTASPDGSCSFLLLFFKRRKSPGEPMGPGERLWIFRAWEGKGKGKENIMRNSYHWLYFSLKMIKYPSWLGGYSQGRGISLSNFKFLSISSNRH